MVRRVRFILILAAAMLVFVIFSGSVQAGKSILDMVIKDETRRPLPGDLDRLERELLYSSSVKYRILVVEDSGSMDKTAYLDKVAAEWGEPKADTMLLVIYARDNHDIRFFMGANLARQGATVDGMVKLLRTHYFPWSQRGDVAGGLARFLAAVNDRYGESMSFPAAAPEVPADVRAAITARMNRYLAPFLSAEQPDQKRLKAARLEELSLMADGGSPVYMAVYSVLPAVQSGTDWVAGSGRLEPDGWVSRKVLLLRAFRENGEIRLEAGDRP